MITFAVYHRAKENRNIVLSPCVFVLIHVTESRLYSGPLTNKKEKGRTCSGRGKGRDKC